MLLFLLACASPPTLEPIEPGAVAPGERVHVSGARFGEDPRAFLTEGTTEIALALYSHSDTELTAQVPRRTPMGEYAFAVRTEEGEVTRPIAVVAPDLERACHGLYRAENRVSRDRDVIVLARYFRDGEEEIEELSTEAVSQVLLTSRNLEDGRTCAGVYLVTDEGMRLFIDDAETDLAPRAKRLAKALDVPFLEG